MGALVSSVSVGSSLKGKNANTVMETSLSVNNAIDQEKKTGTAVVEGFLLFYLKSIPNDVALKVITISPSGRTDFIRYLNTIDFFLFSNRTSTENALKSVNVSKSTESESRDASNDEYMTAVYDSVPQFLLNKFYNDWRKNELIKIQNTQRKLQCKVSNKVRTPKKEKLPRMPSPLSSRKLAAVLPVDEAVSPIATCPHNFNSSSPENFSLNIKDLSETDFSCPDILDIMNREELIKIFRKDTWLSHLICTMENLQMSFTLASASSETRGFPIIYVNKEFENLTGYSRGEAIGQPSSFLHVNDMLDNFWEPRAVQEMEMALSQGNTFCTTLSHFRKNGDLYRSFVYLKPIFDHNDDYLYMMSLQFDVSHHKDLGRSIELSEELLTDIPSHISNYTSAEIELLA
mmetsp:Transcript_12202/g.12287  ORF Transcript_12202/g.12287 Transcript_12202/m.12287 type:complete len:403 (-) Transcript_12202:345-1553(-)